MDSFELNIETWLPSSFKRQERRREKLQQIQKQTRSAAKNAKSAEDVESSWPDLVSDVLEQKRKGDRRRLEVSRRSDVKRSLATSHSRGSDQNLFDGRKVDDDGWWDATTMDQSTTMMGQRQGNRT
uniref:Snurportin1 domain-containing protein n=1 Tax=Caenorhabditis tropicalis TaxID=1561998 RepID=A0A1I7TA59_9PELO